MTTTKTEAERVEFLASLGMKTDAAALSEPAKNTTTTTASNVQLAPRGVDPHTMPVTDITFDPRLLDERPLVTGDDSNAATQYVFSLYKSAGRNKDRNSLLWGHVKNFISDTKRSRVTGGFVKDKVKASKETRELADLLAAHGLTTADLAALLNK